MSDLLPGQKIQKLVTEAVRDAYDKGRESERERIVKMIFNNMSGRDSWLDVISLIKGEQK
jgi:hypothetical protein